MSLKYTRAIVDAIHSGELGAAPYANTPIFNLQVSRALCGWVGGWVQGAVRLGGWLGAGRGAAG